MLTCASRIRGNALIGGCCRGLCSCAQRGSVPAQHSRPRPLRTSVFAFREWDSRRLDPASSSTSTGSTPSSSKRRSSSSSRSSAGSSSAGRRDFLEARQISLYELFDGNAFQLDIPDYQRPYAWKAKQVHELLSDLQHAYTLGQEHFLGAIVTTRKRDTPGEPYWVIDGQQRLTTLVMLLSYLRAWAAAQQGLTSLADRAQHMLFIPADPLNPASQERYRLLLRSCDQGFFEDNFLSSYLPVRYHLSTQVDGPANAAGDYHEALSRHQQQQQQQPDLGNSRRDSSSSNGSRPLANETWWRLYCAGDVMATYLAAAMEDGLSLPDFMAHVLKSCMVVFLTARDESSCFKIFSSLNGRGVDLAVVDKLKPQLMQALTVQQRQTYGDRWSELESALGRPSFHALFDHFMTVELAAAAIHQQGQVPTLQQQSQQAASTPTARGSSSSGSSTGLIPPGSTLMAAQLSRNAASDSSVGAASNGGGHSSSSSNGSGSGGAGWPAQHQHQHLPACRLDVLSYFEQQGDVGEALERVLEYGQRLLEIRANDWSALAAEGGSAPAIAADLEECCFFVNLLSDDCWQPWALEFFAQSADDAKRAAFLRGAELLQLFCELRQDMAFKQERWLRVGYQLLQRPFYSDKVLEALALTPDEADEFLKHLDSRELAAAADERLLVHLLLRADAISRKHVDWRRLKVEKIMPSHPPEGSQWRKLRLLLTALSEEEAAVAQQSTNNGSSSNSQFNPVRSRSSSGGSRGSNGSSNRSGSRSSRGRTLSVDENSAAGTATTSVGSSMDSASSSSSSSSNVPTGLREVRYWHEITRSHWHNRLGNLVLLQPSGHESTKRSHLSADLSAKLQHYAACSGDEHFPCFTGGLVSGRYSRDRFSPEECRQRHSDIINRLISVFGLFSGGI